MPQRRVRPKTTDGNDKTCMVHRCEKCPGTDSLWEYTLRTLLDDGFDRLKMALIVWRLKPVESSKLAEKLFCCISDDLEHDTEFGFEMQRQLAKILP